MSEILVITPDEDGERAQWFVMDAEGELRGNPGHGSLQQAATVAEERRVWLLLDLSQVTRTSSDLPVRGQKLAAALPYALEEQFAEDVEQLHFAAGPPDAQGRMPVAAIRHDLLQRYLDALAAAEIQAVAAYTLHDGLPDLPGYSQFLVTGQTTYLKTVDDQLTALTGQRPAVLLQVWSAGRDADDLAANASHQLRGYIDASLEPALDSEWQQIRKQFPDAEMKIPARGVLAFCARTIANQGGIDLLQGRYAIGRDTLKQLRPWLPVAAMLGVALLLSLFSRFLEWRSFEQRDADLNQAMIAMLPGNNPDIDPVTAEARLAALVRPRNNTASAAGGPAAGPEFLTTVGLLATAIGNDKDTRIEAISFRNGVLDIRLATRDTDALETLRRKIAAEAGLTAQIQRTEQEDERVRSFLQIRSDDS